MKRPESVAASNAAPTYTVTKAGVLTFLIESGLRHVATVYGTKREADTLALAPEMADFVRFVLAPEHASADAEALIAALEDRARALVARIDGKDPAPSPPGGSEKTGGRS